MRATAHSKLDLLQLKEIPLINGGSAIARLRVSLHRNEEAAKYPEFPAAPKFARVPALLRQSVKQQVTATAVKPGQVAISEKRMNANVIGLVPKRSSRSGGCEAPTPRRPRLSARQKICPRVVLLRFSALSCSVRLAFRWVAACILDPDGLLLADRPLPQSPAPRPACRLRIPTLLRSRPRPPHRGGLEHGLYDKYRRSAFLRCAAPQGQRISS